MVAELRKPFLNLAPEKLYQRWLLCHSLEALGIETFAGRVTIEVAAA
jgi:hypothetical protein